MKKHHCLLLFFAIALLIVTTLSTKFVYKGSSHLPKEQKLKFVRVKADIIK